MYAFFLQSRFNPSLVIHRQNDGLAWHALSEHVRAFALLQDPSTRPGTASASRDALARAQQHLSSDTSLATSLAYAEEGVKTGSSGSIVAPINHPTTLPPLRGRVTREAGERRLAPRSQNKCSYRRSIYTAGHAQSVELRSFVE